jgi:hypothetical protein
MTDHTINQKLIFEDSSRLLKVAGIVLMVASLAFLIPGMVVPGWACIAGGAALVLLSCDLTITADRSTRILGLEYRYLLFRLKKEIAFEDIQEFIVEKSSHQTGWRQSRTYRVIAILTNGERVPFKLAFSGEVGKKQQANQLNAILTVPHSQKKINQDKELDQILYDLPDRASSGTDSPSQENSETLPGSDRERAE